MRAVLRQFSHDFDAALADLVAVVRQDPDNGEAWAWQAAIAMVQARYADARTACERMASQASQLIEQTFYFQVGQIGKLFFGRSSVHHCLAQGGQRHMPLAVKYVVGTEWNNVPARQYMMRAALHQPTLR